jgi:hypothetical protein
LFAEQSSIHIAHGYRIDAETLAGDIKATLPLDDPRQELGWRELVKMVRRGLAGVNENIAWWMRAIAEHAWSSDAILYGGFASPPAQAVAMGLNKPAIGLWLQPTTRTRQFASPVAPPWRLPGWANAASYRVSPEAVISRMYGKSAEAARAEMFGGAVGKRKKSAFPILYGFSRHLVPRPSDWPDSHRICGHWALPRMDWQAPPELTTFLSNGPAPIYVGFGAASSFIRQKQLTDIVSAIAGRRALFYPGWSNITQTMLPRNFLVLGDTPHAWLFPQASVVIHHGGAGTTHSAARAGVPSIVVPFGGDQPFWASRLALAGVAPKYVRANKLSEESLARMIEWTEQEVVRTRGRALGAEMTKEDGVAAAVRAIEERFGAG